MNYPGGKGGAGVFQKIINQIPPHRVYIEPFLGGGSIMLNKKPADISIGLDLDMDVIYQWERMGYAAIAVLGDAISFLKEYDFKGDEFVYCDPPYLGETRQSKYPIYKHEMMDGESHRELLSVLLGLPCMVAISGYESSIYCSMLAKWRSITFTAQTRGGASADEWLWMNYAKPKELHDYRYLGDNFRERERLKRIRTNWINRLNRMDELERLMLSAAIAENGGGN